MFLLCRVISSINTMCVFIWTFLFISPALCSFQHTSPVQKFVRFISGTRESSTMLNSSGQSGHPCSPS